MPFITAQEYCENIFDGTHDSPKYLNVGYPLITSKHLSASFLDISSAKRISQSDFEKINKRSQVSQWDILFSMIGTVGRVYLEQNNEIPYAVKNVGVFSCKDRKKALCLYYYLQSPLAKQYISSVASGAVQQFLSLKNLREFPVPRDLTNRYKGIEFLAKIDKKIKLNNLINDNLLQQGKLLFRKWFIDNPASSSWSSSNFAHLLDGVVSGDWGKDICDGKNTAKVSCIRGADIPEVQIGNKSKIPIRYILEKNYVSKHLVDGDIVIEISGGSPTQSTGRAALITSALLDRYGGRMVCTNFCRALKPLPGFSMFIYYYWQYFYDQNIFFSYENGTTGIKNLDLSSFLNKELIRLAPQVQIDRFNAHCRPIFKQIAINGLENEKLTNLRDTLLPMFMAGKKIPSL